jgi:hypothetical protein
VFKGIDLGRTGAATLRTRDGLALVFRRPGRAATRRAWGAARCRPSCARWCRPRPNRASMWR